MAGEGAGTYLRLTSLHGDTVPTASPISDDTFWHGPARRGRWPCLPAGRGERKWPKQAKNRAGKTEGELMLDSLDFARRLSPRAQKRRMGLSHDRE